MSKETQSEGRARRGFGPFTGTHLTIIICTLALVLGLPVGAWAVTASNVFVTDPAHGNRAHVDVNGGLITAVHDPTTGQAVRAVSGTGQMLVSGQPAHPYNNESFEGSADLVTMANPFAVLFSTKTAQHFAITSLTFTNLGGSPSQVMLIHYQSIGATTNCASPMGTVTAGERSFFNIPDGETTNIEFPTPLLWTVFERAGHVDCYDVQLTSGANTKVLANGYVGS